jgi:hypothetical protein
MRLTLTINERLATLGKGAELTKGDGCFFYFSGGEASDWVDRTGRSGLWQA